MIRLVPRLFARLEKCSLECIIPLDINEFLFVRYIFKFCCKVTHFLEHMDNEGKGRFCGKGRTTITEHIGNIFKEGELDEEKVCRKFRHTTQHGAIEGLLQTQEVKYYNLDVIISVGYRVKSRQGTMFRIWATQRLRDYIIRGYALNEERFKKGNSMNYFRELIEKIREIRLEEKVFYQQIKDIYKTSIDYDPSDEITIQFFKEVQNKLLWAVSEKTAAELVYYRANASLPLMGLTSTSTLEKVRKQDILVGKNYLNSKLDAQSQYDRIPGYLGTTIQSLF